MTDKIKKMRSRKELERYANELTATNLVFQSKIEDLEEKLEEANRLLKSAENIPNVEDALLIREIGYLDTHSKRAEGLDLNETKQLKMLVDSLVSLRRQRGDQEPEKKTRSKLPRDPAKLISIAKGTAD